MTKLTTKEFRYECSKCGKKITLATSGERPEKQFCGSCGNGLTFINEDSPFEAEAQEQKEETTPEIKFSFEKPILDKSNLDKLPENIVLKENQNPKCNEEGHFCALWDGADACLKPKNEETKLGKVLFDIEPCSKNKDKGFKIEEIG